jgi:hypothetical protein
VGNVFKPKYSPTGMTYADAKAAGLLVASPTFWIKWRDHAGKIVKEKVGQSEKKARHLLKLRESASVSAVRLVRGLSYLCLSASTTTRARNLKSGLSATC